jgi:hypothetical protein
VITEDQAMIQYNRLRRRRQQRGASMFVIAMAMTLLTGLGLLASQAATMNEQATGYDRLAEQTHYLTEHGALVTMSEIGRSPDAYATALKKATATYNASNPCYANVPCLKFLYDQLNENAQSAQSTKEPLIRQAKSSSATGPDPDPSKNIPGSLGTAPIDGKFLIEVSDGGPAGRPPAGSLVSGGQGDTFQYVMVSVGSWGQVGPFVTNAAQTQCTDAVQSANLVTSRELGRAQIILGPIPKK